MQPFNDARINNSTVSWYEDNGLGDEAVALALIAGCSFPDIGGYYRIHQHGAELSSGSWLRPQRAAIAWCLACDVPLTIRK